MTAIGVLTCVTLLVVLVTRDVSPAGPRRRIWPLRLAEIGLWLLFAAVVVPRLVELVT